MSDEAATELAVFQAHRALLLGLAYRMLGDLARAEDLVQEAWLRWQRRGVEPDSPRAWLVTAVTRLCLNELDSARARREASRPDRLPEPLDLAALPGPAAGLAGADPAFVPSIEDGADERLARLERLSMAVLVSLQRLTPAERAVLLLHEVLGHDHAEIAVLVGKSEPSCRKLLERARRRVAEDRRLFEATREDHDRLLRAFLAAATAGDTAGLVSLLAADATLVTDGGPGGRRVGGVRNLREPLAGAARIAAFVAAASTGTGLVTEVRDLNGQPALVLWGEGDAPVGALLLGVADGRIARVFFHGDAARLRHITRR